MGNGDDNTALALFKALQEAFGREDNSRTAGAPDLVRELAVQAFDSFDGNVAIQIEASPRSPAMRDAPPAATCASGRRLWKSC